MKIGIASTDIGLVDDPENPGEAWTFPGGSFWYRLSQPLTALGMRQDTVVGRLTHNNNILGIRDLSDDSVHWDCDVILMQRLMWDTLPEMMLRARANGQVLINDIDDWFDGLPPSNQAFTATAAASDPSLNREIYKKVLSASSALICSTPFLVEQYARFRRPIHLWRNSIDFESFPKQRQHRQLARYGWFGNLGFRARDVEELRGIIGPFVREHGTTFTHVGHRDGEAKPVSKRVNMFESDMVLLPLQSFMTFSVNMPDWYDVAVVPLEQVRFNDAKSCLKGMEHVAAGIPFIASPSAEYRWLHSYGVGRLAKKPLDWKKHLTELLDKDVREEEALRNLTIMRPLVDVNVTAPLWLDILKSTVA